MKKRDLLLFIFWVSFPLIAILFPFFLTGCTPTEIKFMEEVADKAIEEDLQGR